MNLDQGTKLVKLARDSIITFFSGSTISIPKDPKFNEERGVFVTLSKFGRLRGCIGFPEPVYPLNRAIIESARSAVFNDPRFPPVKEEEMDDITVEVTVLTKPELIEVEEPMEYFDKIIIGKHGLIIRSEFRSGLLLPQVFKDYDATPKQALEMTCQKAGLPVDAWNNKDVKIFSFSGQIFEEEEPHGKIVEKK